MLAKEDIAKFEYDLNIFYEDLGHDADGVNQWSDVYTIQPSIYVYTVDDRALRFYLEAFKLDLAETCALEPDFPDDEYGSDFFIALESFFSLAKAVPARVVDMLNRLPDPLTALEQGVPEINWIN